GHVVNMVDRLSREQRLRRWVILGVAYKPNVGDERNSPSLSVAQRLKDLGYVVAIHDPFVERFNRPLESIVPGADGLLLLTDHTEYRNLNPDVLGRLMARRFVIDTRLCLRVDEWRTKKFVVLRLGDGRRGHLAVV